VERRRADVEALGQYVPASIAELGEKQSRLIQAVRERAAAADDFAGLEGTLCVRWYMRRPAHHRPKGVASPPSGGVCGIHGILAEFLGSMGVAMTGRFRRQRHAVHRGY
jgi:hypothetical protein